MNINRKIIVVIAFLPLVISLTPVTSTALASIDYSDTTVEESFRVLVTVACVDGKRGEELKIIVASKSDTFELCEGNERPSEEKEQIQYRLKDITLNFKKNKLQQENHLMFVLRARADSQIARL